MQYRPEIDGLRAFAVLPVILFHAGIPGFSGGFVGVDVFFVISGYLITTILLNDLSAGRYSLVQFYERRARRILPALFFMISVVTVAAWFILPPIEMAWYGQSVLATALFLSNAYFLVRNLDYFAGATAEYPLLHTWSLAVEEQFYILFPVLLWVFWRLSTRTILWMIAIISLASFLGAEILSRYNQPFNFYMLPTRAWELGAGALCSVLHFRAPARPSPVWAFVGFLLVLASVFLLNEQMRFPSVYAIPPVLGTALVLLYSNRTGMVGAVLCWRPFIWVGLASYSAYLWHQPLFAFTHFRLGSEPGIVLMLALSAFSIVLGWMSLKMIETPFRRRRPDNRSFPLLFGSAAALVGCAFLGYTLHLSLGAPWRSAAPHLPADYYSHAAKPIFPSRGINGAACSNRCKMHDAEAENAPRLLMIGDSHVQDIIPNMREFAERKAWDFDLFINTGCSYTRGTLDQPGCLDAQVRLLNLPFETYDHVLLLNRFSGMMTDLSTSARSDAMQDYIAVIDTVTVAGAQLLLFAPRIQLADNPIRLALENRIDDQTIVEDFAASPAWMIVQEHVQGLDGVQLVDQAELFGRMSCGDRSCFNAHSSEKIPLYRDRHHLSRYAARQLIAHFEPMLDAAEAKASDR